MVGEIRYGSSGVTIDDLNAELDEIWKDFQVDGSWLNRQAEHELQKCGHSPHEALETIKSMARRDAITLRREGAGMDPASTAIVVAFAPVVAKIASDLWGLMIGRIKKKKGEDSLYKKES